MLDGKDSELLHRLLDVEGPLAGRSDVVALPEYSDCADGFALRGPAVEGDARCADAGVVVTPMRDDGLVPGVALTEELRQERRYVRCCCCYYDYGRVPLQVGVAVALLLAAGYLVD